MEIHVLDWIIYLSIILIYIKITEEVITRDRVLLGVIITIIYGAIFQLE